MTVDPAANDAAREREEAPSAPSGGRPASSATGRAEAAPPDPPLDRSDAGPAGDASESSPGPVVAAHEHATADGPYATPSEETTRTFRRD